MGSVNKLIDYADSNFKYTYNVIVNANAIAYENLETGVSENFKFINEAEAIQTKLEDVMKEINDTLSYDAFVFDSVTDLSKAKSELEQLVNNLKSELNSLYSSFETNINDVITEINDNFKWAYDCSVSVTQESKVPISSATTGTN